MVCEAPALSLIPQQSRAIMEMGQSPFSIFITTFPWPYINIYLGHQTHVLGSNFSNIEYTWKYL